MKIHRTGPTVSLLTKLILVLIVQSATLPVEAHVPGVVLTGTGTATIDGVMSPGEWDNAGSFNVLVNVPEGGTTPGTVLIMNDDKNLYLAVRFARVAPDANQSAAFEFDNNHSGGAIENGDDILINNPFPTIGFHDETRTNDPLECFAAPQFCGLFDTDVGGTNDGTGVYANDGTSSIYEFEHPLDSADDAHDFSLSPGDIVGFNLSIHLFNLNGESGITRFPGLARDFFGDIVVAAVNAETQLEVIEKELVVIEKKIDESAEVGDKETAKEHVMKSRVAVEESKKTLEQDPERPSDHTKYYEELQVAAEELGKAGVDGQMTDEKLLKELENTTVEKIAESSKRVTKTKIDDAKKEGADTQEAEMKITESEEALDAAVIERETKDPSDPKASEAVHKAGKKAVEKHEKAYESAEKATVNAMK